MLLFSLPWLSLFNLFVEGVLAQHRVVLLQFDSIRSILPVLGRDVAGRSGHARILVLGALKITCTRLPFLAIFRKLECKYSES